MKKLHYLILLSLFNITFADTFISKNESGITVLSNKEAAGADKYTVDQDVKELKAQIQQVNNSINTTSQPKIQVDKAISASQQAINKTKQLIKSLQNNRDIKQSKLGELNTQIAELGVSVENAKKSVNKNIKQIYQKINQLNSSTNDSIISGENTLETQRNKVYLTKMLTAQIDKYKDLNVKLQDLTILNTNLEHEIAQIDLKLEQSSASHYKYQATVINAQNTSLQLDDKLAKDKSKLNNLKTQQAQLSKLLKQIQEQERRAKLARKLAAQQKTNKNNSGGGVVSNTPKVSPSNQGGVNINAKAIDDAYEDNSPFMSRNLVKPVDGNIKVGFGAKRDGVRNNGVLIDSLANAPVKSVSNGNVMFSGELPGFGQIIVIDNGDNYTSVYSGVLPKVTKGANVKAGEVLASTGVSANQPMDGVYFELRHLGKPVNPMKLFK